MVSRFCLWYCIDNYIWSRYIWVNHYNSLTWNKATWGWFPLLNIIYGFRLLVEVVMKFAQIDGKREMILHLWFHCKPTILGSRLWKPLVFWCFLMSFFQAPVRSSCELHVLTRRSSPVVISAFGSSVRYLERAVPSCGQQKQTETRLESTTVKYYETNLSSSFLLGKYKQCWHLSVPFSSGPCGAHADDAGIIMTLFLEE